MTFAEQYPEAWARAVAQSEQDIALLHRLAAEGKVVRDGKPTHLAPRRVVRGADTIRPKGRKGKRR